MTSPLFLPIKTGEDRRENRRKKTEGDEREREHSRGEREERRERREEKTETEEKKKKTEEEGEEKIVGHRASATIATEPTPPAAPPRLHRR